MQGTKDINAWAKTLAQKIYSAVGSNYTYKKNSNTRFFFTFKAYPTKLKRDEKAEWCQLQRELLSPFKNSYSYQYSSPIGVHLWFSLEEFDGIPESACQDEMPDGIHLVPGTRYTYKQIWKNGTLISCTTIDTPPSTNNNVVLSNSKPWAIENKFVQIVRKPIVWAYGISSVFLLALAWLLVGTATINYQEYRLNNLNEELTLTVDAKLNQQNKLFEYSRRIQSLNDWSSHFGDFPSSISGVLTALSELGETTVNNIEWQNKRLSVEFVSTSIDVTMLVDTTQNLPNVTTANIKPHNAKDTWIIEVQW